MIEEIYLAWIKDMTSSRRGGFEMRYNTNKIEELYFNTKIFSLCPQVYNVCK